MEHNRIEPNYKYIIAASIPLIIFDLYYSQRRKKDDDSDGDDNNNKNKKELIPLNKKELEDSLKLFHQHPSNLQLPWYIRPSMELYLQQHIMSDLHDYIIQSSLSIISNDINTIHKFQWSSLNILDCGCSTGNFCFKLAYPFHSSSSSSSSSTTATIKNKFKYNIDKIVGIDVIPQFIELAKNTQQQLLLKQSQPQQQSQQQQSQEKCIFLCGNGIELLKDKYSTNHFDIGYCLLVLHDMPDRWPMNLLSELGRVCKYIVILDWIGPHYPWTSWGGVRNRTIEFFMGPKHFAGFQHFVELGGISAHIQALLQFQPNYRIVKEKILDGATMKLYIVDTINTISLSKL